ncbi:nitrate reductase [Campylobacter sp. LR291e]|nr:nitrate reductase [Campylobacter sp. LR286c]KAA6228336.1 nitrate reductase [Campylobacter sp. LR196d]KAA6229337.1 nitrate reductase [Campylobacter sp. LR291e]
MKKNKLFIFLLVIGLFLSSCNDANASKKTAKISKAQEEMNSDTLGFRKGDLADEKVVFTDISYAGKEAGESILYERAFENAPPLISHAIEDMLPITADNNLCLSCHDKAIAGDVGATSLPATHYYDYRNNKSTGDILSDSRFNCTACHVAQSDAKPIVANVFKAEFKDDDLKKKSNLIDVMNEGVDYK